MNSITGYGFRAVCHCGWESENLYGTDDEADNAVAAHIADRDGDGWNMEPAGDAS